MTVPCPLRWSVLVVVLFSLSFASIPVSSLNEPVASWSNGAVEQGLAAATSWNVRKLGESNVTCPLDFSILKTYTWVVPTCAGTSNKTICCEAALSAMGLGLAKYLRETNYFELPDEATVDVCLNVFRQELETIGLQRDVVTECFNGTNSYYSWKMFIRGPSLCQGIQTTADFKRVVGVTPMDSSCKSNLSKYDQCLVCINDMESVINSLSGNNTSECFDFVLIYAAGVVNTQGPWDSGTARCILAAPDASSKKKARHTARDIGLGAAFALIVSIAAGLVWYVHRHRRHSTVHRAFVQRHSKLLKPNVGLVWYSWEELKAATLGFSPKQLVGQGGFGTVYHGILRDGTEVAVKRFHNCTPEGDADFVNEVEVISSMRHRNLVVLRGCCVASNSGTDGHQRLLVYDFMARGSLADCLFGKNPVHLAWPERRKIGVGMAQGLAYLHSEVVPQIIHRDVKASNVLLDAQFNVRVADFGLAKLAPEGASHYTTHVAGTHGYVAPEYALYGQLTEKSDVYSFGVCLLELLSGRPALQPADSPKDSSNLSLITDWAWWLVKEGRLMDIMDSHVRETGPRDVMRRFVLVGILCAHLLVAFRPTMTEVLKMLEGDCPIPELPDRPLPLTHDVVDLENPYSYSAQSTPRGLSSISTSDLLR